MVKKSIIAVILIGIMINFVACKKNPSIPSETTLTAITSRITSQTTMIMQTMTKLNDMTNEQLKKMVENGEIPANIEKLDFGYSDKLTDITPLKSLTNLRELTVKDCKINDVTPIKSLTSLTYLDLGSDIGSDMGDTIKDITPLESLINLTFLNLGYNKISDLRPLSSLVNLKTLYLYDNQIKDIGPLSSLVNLESLGLSGNKINDIKPLSSLINLQTLNFDINNINDLTPLQSLKNLKHLFSFTDIPQKQKDKIKELLPNCVIDTMP